MAVRSTRTGRLSAWRFYCRVVGVVCHVWTLPISGLVKPIPGPQNSFIQPRSQIHSVFYGMDLAFLCVFARPVPIIFMLQTLIFCGRSIRRRPKRTSAPIVGSTPASIMRLYRSSLKIPDMSVEANDMERELLPQKSEHSINNVNYQITASFQEADDKNFATL